MASPANNNLRSPSASHPGMKRTVTAPDLAAALQETQKAQKSHKLRMFHSRSSTDDAPDSHSKDDLDGLSKDDLDGLSKDDLDGLSKDDSERHTPIDSGSGTPTSSEALPPKRGLPTPKAWQTYFMQEVAGDKFLEFELLLMTVATGVLDAMTYTAYNVFTSKQTGNTLFLAMYAFRLPALTTGVEENVGVVMGVFVLGAIFFGHIGHLTRQRRRIWLLVSNAFQAVLMLAAAAIRYWVSRRRTGSGAMAILALLAFAESGQIANALNVAMPELNTTMVTGALIQLCTDKRFFKLKNAKRNRRMAFYASMLLGCMIGTAVIRYLSPSAALVVTAATKGLLFFLFFLNRGMIEKNVTVEDGKGKMEGYATPVSRILWGD